MKGFGDLYKSEKIRNKKNKFSYEQIINQAIQFHLKGNIKEATKYYQILISKNTNDPSIYSNYGIILRDQGKLKEAELSTRKAIQINPNFADAHSNLGIILIHQGKLKEAELSTRKAIEINPNFADAHSILGIILKNEGELKEAELYIRKAIQINPNFADAYSNLGIILKDQGKLKEAELSTRKAIEINPNFEDAYSNLENILRNQGKLNELLISSESKIKSRTNNHGYRLLSLLEITIANLIIGNFSEIILNINKIEKGIKQGDLNFIKENHLKKNTLGYFQFIKSLIPLLDKENKNQNLEIIPHFGESHCLSFSHQSLSISSKVKKIQPVLIMGAKAWHFANNQNNQWKDSLTQQMKNHNYSDKVFISFGEIDCRKDEGILNYSIKNDKDISEVCEKTIKGYLNYMEKKLSEYYSEKYYFGIPAPTREKDFLDELDIRRIKMIKTYNLLLKKEVLYRDSYFLDVYQLTSNNDGINNNIHMCDETHLSPKCLPILLKNYLHKR